MRLLTRRSSAMSNVLQGRNVTCFGTVQMTMTVKYTSGLAEAASEFPSIGSMRSSDCSRTVVIKSVLGSVSNILALLIVLLMANGDKIEAVTAKILEFAQARSIVSYIFLHSFLIDPCAHVPGHTHMIEKCIL